MVASKRKRRLHATTTTYKWTSGKRVTKRRVRKAPCDKCKEGAPCNKHKKKGLTPVLERADWPAYLRLTGQTSGAMYVALAYVRKEVGERVDAGCQVKATDVCLDNKTITIRDVSMAQRQAPRPFVAR